MTMVYLELSLVIALWGTLFAAAASNVGRTNRKSIVCQWPWRSRNSITSRAIDRMRKGVGGEGMRHSRRNIGVDAGAPRSCFILRGRRVPSTRRRAMASWWLGGSERVVSAGCSIGVLSLRNGRLGAEREM
jgi:hypothetical protein